MKEVREEPKPLPDEPKPAPEPDPVEGLVAAWNALAGELALPGVEKITPERRRTAKVRIGEGMLAHWSEIASVIRTSPFHRGDNDRGWRANFDWLMRPGWIKLVEAARAPAARRNGNGNGAHADDENDWPPGYQPTTNGPSPFDVASDSWVPRTERMRTLWDRHKAAHRSQT